MSMYELFDLYEKKKPEIRMDAGQLDIPPDSRIVEELRKYMDEFKYAPTSGLEELRGKIAEIHGVEASETVVVPGAKFGIAALLHGVKDVTLIAPHWPGYRHIAELNKANLHVIRTSLEHGWMPDEEFEVKGALVINYPNNPTGVVADKRFLEFLRESTRGLIVSDETYSDIYYDGKPASIIDLNFENCALVYSFSKTFSFPALRLGYVIAPRDVVKKVVEYIRATVTCVSPFIQRAAILALELKNEIGEKIRKTLHERVKVFSSTLGSCGFRFLEPRGAFYFFIDVEEDGTVFSRRLLDKGVSVFPGEFFGEYRTFIRASLTVPREKLVKAAKLFCEVARN